MNKVKKVKKFISYLVCTALIVAGIPVSISRAEESVQSVGDIIVEGGVENKQIYIKVLGDGLIDAPTSGITYSFSAKQESISKSIQIPLNKNEKQILSKDVGDASTGDTVTIKIEVSYTDTKGIQRKDSKDIKVTDQKLIVDCLPDVTVNPASQKGATDGSIQIKNANNNLQFFEVGNIGNAVDFDNYVKKDLEAEKTYGVKFKEDALKDNEIGLKELYAEYEIPIKSAENPTSSPDATTTPTSTPVSTSTATPTPAPTKTPGISLPPSWTSPTPVPTQAPTATPTEAPTVPPVETVAPTQAPTVPPAETVAPTQAPTVPPVETAEPTEKPAETTKPIIPVQTQQPPATSAPENIDMSKSGTEVTVGGNSYKSTGSGSVSYTGSDLASAKTVTVPDTVTVNGKKYPVTEVGSKAFAGSKIQKVKIGSNVKKIGTNSFKGCKNLKTVTFPSKLNQVGDGAFNGCTKLSSATLPTSVKKIGDRAFKNCKSLKKFTIGKKPVKTKKGNIMFGGTANKITIGASALENCMKLRQVIINSQVTKIGNATFKNCKKLASIMVRSLMLQKVGGKALVGVNNCKISVPTIRLKKYRTLFKNKGQGKKVVIAKV